MKDRFNALDVRAVVANIRSTLLGYRAANIYDINPRTYMFKLADTGKEKKLILIESGMRVHSTKYMRDIPKIPSIFTLKLRKHVRGKRLTDVRQLGIDRVIDFTFGSNEATYHIIIELHSKGNVILTDHKY
ncbi:MAG: NFACT family protein, partial [Cytophagales bacterium]|nr:NFACT family protein [Cytophagales bacterium]